MIFSFTANACFICSMYTGHNNSRFSGPQANQDFGYCTNKIPPKWNSDLALQYPFDTWTKDVRLWAVTAIVELAPEQLGPLVALGLGGAAKDVGRDLASNQLNELQYGDGTVTGIEWLLQQLHLSLIHI